MRLKEVINFQNGKKKPNTSGNIPIYGGNGILGFTNKSNAKLDNIIIGRVGAYCGCVYKNDDECWVSDNAIVGHVNNGFNYKYIYYKLKSLNLNKLHIGSSHPLMTQDILKDIEIDMPKLEIQTKIGNILNLLDEKIELNNKINDNLLNIIKNYYRGKFYNKNGKITILSSLIKQTIGGDWGKENKEGNYNKKVYCIRGADIPQMVYGNKGKAPIRYILEKNYNNKKLLSNEIIIEISGGSPSQSTGRVAFISKDILKLYENSLICTNFCRAIELIDEKYAPLLYVYLLNLYDDKIFFNYENGTTGIKNLSLTDLTSKEYIFIPNDDELRIFNNLFYSLLNKIVENSNENQNLEKLRDILLPKLMNGEIDLENIEI